MSGNLGPITVEVQFNGESYLAEITPTINGNPVALRPAMHQAEAAQRIYTRKLQEMLSKSELVAGYKPEYGFLTEATLNGFKFEKGSLGHGVVTTEILWKDFVDSLHTPEPFLSAARSGAAPAPSEVGPGLHASFANISAYMNLSANEKKLVHMSALFKVLKEFEGKDIDPYTDPEKQYLRHIIAKHKISKTDTEIFISRLYHNLPTSENPNERFSEEEMMIVNTEWLRIRETAPSVSTPVIQDNSTM
jgi:hypothetical protein